MKIIVGLIMGFFAAFLISMAVAMLLPRLDPSTDLFVLLTFFVGLILSTVCVCAYEFAIPTVGFEKAWRGEKPLWEIFLVYNVLFNIIFGVGVRIFPVVLAIVSGSMSYIPVTMFYISRFFMIFSGIFIVVYEVWIGVAIWRCARNSHTAFKVLARVWVIMQATLSIFIVVGTFFFGPIR